MQFNIMKMVYGLLIIVVILVASITIIASIYYQITNLQPNEILCSSDYILHNGNCVPKNSMLSQPLLEP